MPVKDCKTEQHLKNTAKKIFLTEGKMFATTQDIADAAGVNRTLLHYYFRSREALFNIVFTEALSNLRTRLHEVMGSAEEFYPKIEKFIDVFFDELTKTPYLETFIVLQLNQEPEKYNDYFTEITGGAERTKKFLHEIQMQITQGNIRGLKPLHFFMNLFSLMAYPFVSKPIYLNMFHMNERSFQQLLSERKKVILSTLFVAHQE